MAIDCSPPPPSQTSDFPAEMTQTNQVSQNEARKNVIYKTKEIKFGGRKNRIILQNENGPCPLIAICNVLLLRNKIYLYPDRFQVSQERLISLVADRLCDQSDAAISLLPRFADGINVNIKFRSIDDFERTPELAIFDLLKIPLYHGWIFDPQDFETATVIGCKSYNDLMTGIVTLETQTVKARIGQICGECSVDFTAALGIPSQRCSKTRSFADSTPTSAEHSSLGRGDIEEERVLLQALRLSEREKLGLDTRRDSSSGGESASGYSDLYLTSEDYSLFDFMDTASGCTSSPGSVNICQKSKCDGQFSSKESGDEIDCVVGNIIDVGEEVCSKTLITKSSGAIDHDHLSLAELGDENVCDVETENSSKTTALHLTSSDMISAENSNLESTKNDSSSEISLKSEAVTFVNPDLIAKSQEDDQFSFKEAKDATDCDVGNKISVWEESRYTTSITKSGALNNGQLSSTKLGDETDCDFETENSSKMTVVHVTLEKTNLESTKNDSSSEIQFKSEAVTFVNPDLIGKSQEDDVPLYETEKGVTVGSPVYEGESFLGQSSPEGKDIKGLTPREGEVIKNFLNNNASQLTFPGLFFLQEGLEEGQLCVFFRNNHFYTMLKNDNALYNLVTDQGYLNERDLVWEKLNQVNGDSVFVTGDFKVFKCDSGNWDQQDAFSNTADYIHSINSSSKEGMEIDPDFKIAMELQAQELGEDSDFEVSIKKQSHVFFFNTRSESSPKMVQIWQMYNHVYKSSSSLLRSV